MLELLFSINTTLILKHARFLTSNNSVPIKFIISFLIIVFQCWEFIVHYFVSVSYMPSCVNGSRNFKMTKLEEPRRAGIPVAHMGMGKKWIFLWTIFLQVYIRANQFITLSLMRNELYIQLNCHPNCALLKWLDRLKNMLNTCSIMVEMLLLYCIQDILVHFTISLHVYLLGVMICSSD